MSEASCAAGGKVAGVPLTLPQVRSVSRAMVVFSQPSASLPNASAFGIAFAAGVAVAISSPPPCRCHLERATVHAMAHTCREESRLAMKLDELAAELEQSLSDIRRA